MILQRISALCIAALVVTIGAQHLTAPAISAGLIGSTGETIVIDASKGGLLRLDRTPATIFIADPEVADLEIKSPRLIYLIAKKPGETTLFAVDAAERVIVNRRIRVRHNVTRLNESIRKMSPNSRIEVRAIDGTIVLGGTANTAKDAENARQLARNLVASDDAVVNQIQVVAPNQINLRVRIAEVARTIQKQFGINWDTLFRTGAFTWGIADRFRGSFPAQFLRPNRQDISQQEQWHQLRRGLGVLAAVST